MTYLIFETTMVPIFSSQKYLTNMQIRRSYDKKLTNDYESPKLVTCGWNSLSELSPLYSLKSNPPPPPICIKFPLKNQNYFINLRDWQRKFTLKR